MKSTGTGSAPIGKRAAQRAARKLRKKGDQRTGGRTQMFTYQQLADALEKSVGSVSLAAARLRVTRQTIYDYLDRYPELKDVRLRTLYLAGDMAFAQLYLAIEKGERWAVLEGIRRFGRFCDPEVFEAEKPKGFGGHQPQLEIFFERGPDNVSRPRPDLTEAFRKHHQ